MHDNLSQLSYDLREFDSIPAHLRNSSRRMLEVINLDCVRGSRALFTNLNLKVGPGTFVQLQGPNGSGKTSLLRIICGLLAPEKGEVRWQSTNIRKLGEDFAGALTYLGHRNAIKDELSALENLRVSNGLSGLNINREEATQALDQLGLQGRENLPARFLSEGQKRRAALARLIVSKAKLWLLDEVLASLDTSAILIVNALLERHLQTGGIVIAATHHEMHVEAHSFVRLDLGSLGPSSNQPIATGLRS